MRRRGFTLVELLVVISVIGVLIAMLLPTLGVARETARSAACMSNLRQIATPYATYAQDFQDWFPPVGSWQTISWHVIFGNLGYVGAGLPHPLYPTQKRWPVYRCPSEVGSNFGQDGVWHNGSFEEGVTYYMAERRGTSYGMNRSLSPIYNEAGASLDTPRRGYYEKTFTPDLYGYAPQVYGPSDAALVMDLSEYGTGTNFHPCWFDSMVDAFGPAGTWEEYCFVNYQYAFRHGGQRMGWVFQGSSIEVGSANVLFLDGHVANRPHSVISGQKIYTPMFHGN